MTIFYFYANINTNLPHEDHYILDDDSKLIQFKLIILILSFLSFIIYIKSISLSYYTIKYHPNVLK